MNMDGYLNNTVSAIEYQLTKVESREAAKVAVRELLKSAILLGGQMVLDEIAPYGTKTHSYSAGCAKLIELKES